MYKVCLAITIINSVILVYTSALPAVQSVYEVIKIGSQDEKIKCPYLRESKLIKPEPEFLKTCVDFGKYSLLKSVTKATENDALCILYYNSFLSFCFNSNNLTAEKYNFVTMQNKMPTNVTEACATLRKVAHIVAKVEGPVNATLSTLKSEGRCSRLCSDLDGNLLPICSNAAYMVSATGLINATYVQAGNEKHISEEVHKNAKVNPVPHKVTPQSREDEHLHSNAAADEAKGQHVKDHDGQQENSLPEVKESKLTPQVKQESPTKLDKAKLSVKNSEIAMSPAIDKSISHNEKSVSEKQSDPGTIKSDIPINMSPEKPPTQMEEQSKPELEKSHKDSSVVAKQQTKQPTDIDKNPTDIAKNPTDIAQNPHGIPKSIPKKAEIDSKPETPASINKNPVSVDTDLASSEKMKEDVFANPNEQEEGGFYESHDGETDTNNDVADIPKPKEAEKPSTNSKPHETKEDTLPLNYGENMDSDDSYFFSYFMMVCAVFILAYVGYHNKQKVLALVLEGRRGRRPSRTRRPNSANYHKLDSNLEEAVTSSCNKNATNIIY